MKTPVSRSKAGARKGKKSKAHQLLAGVYRRHPCVARSTAVAVLKAIDSPFSKQLLDYLEKGDPKAFIEAKINALDYDDVEAFRRDYLCVEFMSKFPNWELGINREEIALESFYAAEGRCSASNRVLARAFEIPSTGVSTASYMYTAQRKIARLLGPFSWDEAEQDFGFGPGASYKLPRKHGDTYHKLGCRPEVTRECAVLAYTALRRCPMWFAHVASFSGGETIDDLFEIVPGNRITTVPKNAKTDRVIAIEPVLNMFLQKGIGGVIRSELRRVGINLNDQAPNQRLAKEGSITGQWATIDLSAASDSIAYELVRCLLPSDWFAALELCRSSVGILPSGEKIFYQKFSSMGNGYTFELESLIFWALISSVESLLGRVGSGCLVYGDDIVVPTDLAPAVIEVLSYCGFSCNEKKTFIDGPFRESCGKHYFRGTDVTPFYVRKDMNVEQMLLFCNNLRRYSRLAFGLDGRFQSVYEEAVSMLPQKLRRPRIPDGFGDQALIGDFDECLPRRAPRGLEGFQAAVRLPVSVVERVGGWPYLLRQLLRMPVREFDDLSETMRLSGGDSPLGAIPRSLSYKVCKVLVPQWVNFGPWLTSRV